MTCERCGQCCESIGYDKWRESPVADSPLFARLKYIRPVVNLDLRDSVQCAAINTCAMLFKTPGKSYCAIQVFYGDNAKPEFCKNTFCARCKNGKAKNL